MSKCLQSPLSGFALRNLFALQEQEQKEKKLDKHAKERKKRKIAREHSGRMIRKRFTPWDGRVISPNDDSLGGVFFDTFLRNLIHKK